MKTTSWTRKQFCQLAGGLVFSACVASANAQQTNNAPVNPADPYTDSVPNLPDSERQSKAREALRQAEIEQEAREAKVLADKTKAAAASAANADQLELNNWVEVGVGGNVGSGDKAQFQKQSGLPARTAYGGITAFHYETPVDKKGLFSLDGRGIFDNHDYELTLSLEKPDAGYVRAGLRQYRE